MTPEETGAVTHPYYNTRNRIGKIALKDHEYGAVLVDVKSPTNYVMRQIKAFRNGKFSDIDGTYTPIKHIPNTGVEAMVLGDIHPYDTDPAHEKVSLNQIQILKPKKLFLHDTFNGKTISHHNVGKSITRNSEAGNLTLEDELKYTAKILKKYAKSMNEFGDVYIVASNHDEHLFRYLDEGRFVGDKGNDHIGSILYTKTLEGHNPFEYAMRELYDVPENVKFLTRNDSMRIRGYEMAHHGDLGANGGRGSVISIENANGKSITAHSHSAMKKRDTYKVGTSTHYRIGYNRGLSNWSQTNAVLYESGQVQLLNTIKRKWK